jgi:exopolyphosphatase / guanosine-5'-triphosphate,3'-diphosphate pyrophosphatase
MLAALDLGTNNCRLLIAEPQGHTYKVVDTFSRSVRLGTGVWLNNRIISQESMDRTFDALRECVAKLDTYPQITRKRFVATEACRYASNSHVLINRVKSELDLNLKIISHQEEARLATLSTISLLDKGYDRVMLFDIGGGSTELVWLNLKSGIHKKGGFWLPEIVTWKSLPKGVVSLADEFVHNPSEGLYNKIVAETYQQIKDFYTTVKELDKKNWKSFYLLGTSGTITTLAALSLGIKKYNRFAVDGLWLHDATIMELIKRIQTKGYYETSDSGFIGLERADLMQPGCAILQAILQFFPSIRLRAADRGIREGIIHDLLMDNYHLHHKKKK